MTAIKVDCIITVCGGAIVYHKPEQVDADQLFEEAQQPDFYDVGLSEFQLVVKNTN